MIGVIHWVLFDLIRSLGGEDALATVKERAGIPSDTEFRLNAAYDDAQWRRLLAATCETLNITPEEAAETFADYFYRDALARWPAWFQMAGNSLEFLARQPAIHNSLSAGLRDEAIRQTVADKFRVERDELSLTTHYASENRHCGLYMALARRIIEHYGDEASIAERACLLRGDPECEIRIVWTKLGSAS